jgi:hypothetical protein
MWGWGSTGLQDMTGEQTDYCSGLKQMATSELPGSLPDQLESLETTFVRVNTRLVVIALAAVAWLSASSRKTAAA